MDLAGRTIVVTGAVGFIGWRVCELLLDAGTRVVGLDNLSDGYDPRLKDWRWGQLRERQGFTFHRGDVEDLDLLHGLLREARPEAVINLAARAGVRYSMENPHVYVRTNTNGVVNVMEAMRAAGVRKLVQASTSAVYAGHPLPFVETQPVNRPISPYAASKKAAETFTYTYHHLYGLDVSVLRYFTVYGPAGRPDMSPLRFIRWIDEGHPIQLFGDGEQSRDFTYVDDIARGTIAALRPLGHEVINLGGGAEPFSINRMIACFAAALGKEPIIQRLPASPADMDHTRAEIAKAATLLNWTPSVKPEEGFRRTVAWYQANRDLVRSLKL